MYRDAPKPTNNMAVVSIAAGLASWMGFVVIGAIVAIVAGHMARAQIRQTGEDGDGLAIAGLVLGYAHLVTSCIGTVVVVLMFGGFLAAFTAVAASQ